jgi:hypothetical protein
LLLSKKTIMRVSSWSLWLVLSAVAGISLSDDSSGLHQHPQIVRRLQDDLTGRWNGVVLDETEHPAPGDVATDAPVDSTFNEAPTEPPAESSTLTEAESPAPDVGGGNTPTGVPTGDGTASGAPAGDGTIAEAPAGDGTIAEAPIGNSTFIDAPGDDEVATEAPGGDETGVPSSSAPSTGFGTDVETPAPTPSKAAYIPPTYGTPTYEYPAPDEPPTYPTPTQSDPAPAPTPKYSSPTAPSYKYPTPTVPKPVYELPATEDYVPPDDDPIKNEGTAEEEEWRENLTVGQMEEDRNVLIALSTVAGIGFLLIIITAHQMMENPDGCCATICRITVACSCALFRLVCFPCRMVCGCTNKDRRTHELMQPNYTHDLELS